MTVLKCKMCGGTLNVTDDSGVAVCEYCGTKQTISKTNDDVLSNLYNRANNLRLKNEFDWKQRRWTMQRRELDRYRSNFCW